MAKEPLTITIDPESDLGRALNESYGGPVVLLCGDTRFRAGDLTRTGHHAGLTPPLSIYIDKCYTPSCAERRSTGNAKRPEDRHRAPGERDQPGAEGGADERRT